MLPNLLVPSSPRDSFYVSVRDDDFKVSQSENETMDNRLLTSNAGYLTSEFLLSEGTQVASIAQLV